MDILKKLGIIGAIIVVLCSAIIANSKFNKWNTYKQTEITKNYLSMLEDEAGNLGTVGRMGIYRKAVEKVTKE